MDQRVHFRPSASFVLAMGTVMLSDLADSQVSATVAVLYSTLGVVEVDNSPVVGIVATAFVPVP